MAVTGHQSEGSRGKDQALSQKLVDGILGVALMVSLCFWMLRSECGDDSILGVFLLSRRRFLYQQAAAGT